jgi:meso-butanediol dehydrogenase / (S,S)-butanediol dehydrogenase / diacetyl reductase
MQPHFSTQTTPVALITGAARGIGLAIAKAFLASGHRVALLDIDADELDRALAQINQPSRTLRLVCDVADAAQVNASVADVEKHFGRIDALVNNAGVAVFKPILDTAASEWQRVMDVNLTGPFLCTQACARVMLRNEPAASEGAGSGKAKGSVVNIASISGLRASSLRVAYGTSKAGLIHLTKQQAMELGNAGIRVNAVAPGPVETAMAKQVHTADIRRDYHDTIALGRYGSEEEIAQVVHFLCSPAASYVNGQTIAVDGGFDAGGIGLPSLRAAL